MTLNIIAALIPTIICAAYIVRALITGVAPQKGGNPVKKSENPKAYWITVAFFACMFLFCLAFIARIIIKRIAY
jgi:hypothetical protein